MLEKIAPSPPVEMLLDMGALPDPRSNWVSYGQGGPNRPPCPLFFLIGATAAMLLTLVLAGVAAQPPTLRLLVRLARDNFTLLNGARACWTLRKCDMRKMLRNYYPAATEAMTTAAVAIFKLLLRDVPVEVMEGAKWGLLSPALFSTTQVPFECAARTPAHLHSEGPPALVRARPHS